MGYYDMIAHSYNELHGDEQLNKLSIIMDNIEVTQKTRLLDVGCGTGLSSGFNCFVVGIDPALGMLRINRSKIKVAGCAERLPFRDNSFDIVISVTAIHNFSSIGKAVQEMSRVCRGQLVFTILKKANDFEKIAQLLESSFIVSKKIEGEKDTIIICGKPQGLYIENNYLLMITNETFCINGAVSDSFVRSIHSAWT